MEFPNGESDMRDTFEKGGQSEADVASNKVHSTTANLLHTLLYLLVRQDNKLLACTVPSK